MMLPGAKCYLLKSNSLALSERCKNESAFSVSAPEEAGGEIFTRNLVTSSGNLMTRIRCGVSERELWAFLPYDGHGGAPGIPAF
jgi:hypothetical protein